MEELLVAYLLANAGLAALAGTQIKWAVLPQGGTLPAVAMIEAGARRTRSLDGRDKLTGYRIRFSCWGETFASAVATKRALIVALDGLRAAPFRGVDLQGDMPSLVDAATDGPAASNGSDIFHRAGFDALIWFEDQF
ncbi:DUF3168 domain-containing protein [Phenylobacterium sp.]|uniref:DUF3168 domain-containing protein n=1 Tax=Phenylobacterium sp. TaxID=1871053 RepID=UPI002F3E387A